MHSLTNVGAEPGTNIINVNDWLFVLAPTKLGFGDCQGVQYIVLGPRQTVLKPIIGINITMSMIGSLFW